MSENEIKHWNKIFAEIMDWSEEHPEFDPSFIEKLTDDLENRGNLTSKQLQAVRNIIDKWEIPVDTDLD